MRLFSLETLIAVSYTHLDVYKRQEILRQLQRRLLTAQTKQTGGKINHIPICLTAKAVEDVYKRQVLHALRVYFIYIADLIRLEF